MGGDTFGCNAFPNETHVRAELSVSNLSKHESATYQ